MLIGSHNHTVDNKGRLFIPSKWRDDLGTTFIVTKGFGKCLFECPFPNGKTFRKALRPAADGQAVPAASQIPSSWATDCEVDKQGRILIPAKLRAFAQLEKDATLIGVTNRIEIWNSTLWETMDTEMEAEYDEMMAGMAKWVYEMEFSHRPVLPNEVFTASRRKGEACSRTGPWAAAATRSWCFQRCPQAAG